MPMRVECFGYDLVIRPDRYDEAREWLEDALGYDALDEYADLHGIDGDGLMHLSLGEAWEEGPFWGQVAYGTMEILEDFVEEFACEGSFLKLATEDDTASLTMIKAGRSSVERRTVGIEECFDEIEEELDSMISEGPEIVDELVYQDAIFQYGLSEFEQIDDR